MPIPQNLRFCGRKSPFYLVWANVRVIDAPIRTLFSPEPQVARMRQAVRWLMVHVGQPRLLSTIGGRRGKGIVRFCTPSP